MINNHFLHRQYSGYVSIGVISKADTVHIVDQMARKFDWLHRCIMQFDITLVSDEYGMVPRIKQESMKTSTELY